MSNQQPIGALDLATLMAGPPKHKSIALIGGSLNGKHVLDVGQMEHKTHEGGVYKRVKLDAGDSQGRIQFDVLAYWGREEEIGV